MSSRLFAAWLGLLLYLWPSPARPQSSPAQESAGSTTMIPAGARYRAGWLHRFLLGSHYRELWTTPIQLPFLDLTTVAGGLSPTTAGGRFQSRSLRFRARDGRQFSFRLVDKNPVSVLPVELRQTIAADVVQDQTSAGHPAAPLVVGPLLDAAGILHSRMRFVVLRDEPALGRFRDEFVGKLGTFEERILSPGPEERGFGGATRIVSSDTLFAILARDAREQVDARVLLTARLMDLFVGDMDRHRGQWSWARLDDAATPGRWVPIPEDRDQALIRYDGFLLMLARLSYPELLNFGDRYGDLIGATRAGSELDRKLLSPLPREAWDSIAAATSTRLTDSVIEHAVAQAPAEYRPLDSARLATTLKRRRDQLPEVAGRFYQLLAREAEVHATDVAEQVDLERRPDGAIDLRMFAPGSPTPFFARRYLARETGDLRLYLHGGDDRVTVRGAGRRPITVRVIGGDGNDVFVDSAGGTRFYDTSGDDRVTRSRGTRLDRRPSIAPIDPDAPWLMPRDFGRDGMALPWFSYAPDLGLLAGLTGYTQAYGFRKYPFASRITARAGYATTARAARLEVLGDFRKENSRARSTMLVRASQLEIIRFYGLGNEVVATAPADFYQVRQGQLIVHPATSLPLGARAQVSVGPVLRYARTRLESGQFITLLRPYGTEGYGTTEGFGQLGARAGITWDTRDEPGAARRGARLAAEGTWYPGLWDVRRAFGEVHGEAATYLSARVPLRPTLALRVAGKRVFGTYPFHEAAYLGGTGTLRGFSSQRFAGDAAVYGNAELRMFLTRFFLVLPGDLGVFGLADAGRVFLKGETSTRWHSSAGGGIWFSFLRRANTLSVAVARSEERTGVYLSAGFMF